MATRSETLRGGATRSVWIMLFAVVLLAAALAIGALVGGDGESTAPARPPAATEVRVEPPTHVAGLVKAGLQPRPFSEIQVREAPSTEIPDGFMRMRGGELRPTAGSRA